MAYPTNTDQASIIEYLLAQTVGVDTRQGSIIYDALAPGSHLAAQQYIDLQITQDAGLLDTSFSPILPLLCNQFGVEQRAAVKSEREFIFTGTEPGTGTRYFADDIYWVKLDNGNVECETTGVTGNLASVGTQLVPVLTQTGLTSSSLGDIVIPGSEIEDDEILRERTKQSIADPQLNSNKAQVKFWCEEVEGIGLARILSLWDGANTVKAVLLDSSFQPASVELVDEVQELIDPNSLGLGEGLADIGLIFTAATAGQTDIDVSATVVLEDGFTIINAKNEFELKLIGYLKDVTKLDVQEVSYNFIGALIINSDSIKDYSNLTLNGGSVNVAITNENAGVVGTTTFTE